MYRYVEPYSSTYKKYLFDFHRFALKLTTRPVSGLIRGDGFGILQARRYNGAKRHTEWPRGRFVLRRMVGRR